MGRWLGISFLLAAMSARIFAADSYTLDSAHSIPVFEFTHLGLTTQSGRFDKAAGVIVLDIGAKKGSVTYEVDTSSLNMGFGTETPNSPGFLLFDIKRFPKITFKSTSLIFDNNNNVVAAKGQLTLLSVTKPITVAVNHFKCSVNSMNKMMTCAGDITANIKRSEFGMVRYIPSISDEIKISIPVEAYKN